VTPIVMMEQSPVFVRDLSAFESLFHWTNVEKDSFLPVQIACSQTTKSVSTSLLKSAFFESCGQLLQNYQVLRCSIKEKGKLQYYFQEWELNKAMTMMHESGCVSCVDRRDKTADYWQQYTQSMVMQGRKLITRENKDEESLLWRVVLIYDSSNEENSDCSDFEIIMTASHGICDGHGLMVLLNDLMEQMESYIGSGSTISKPSEPVSAPLEFVLSNIEKKEKRNDEDTENKPTVCGTPVPHPNHCGSIPPLVDRQAILAFRTLSESDSAQLLSACRRNNTTVNGAICAAVIRSGFHHLFDLNMNDPANTYFSTYVSVSLRNQCSIPMNQLGLYYTGLAAKTSIKEEMSTPLDNDHFWTLARSIQRQIHDYVNQGEFDSCAAPNWLDNVTNYMDYCDQTDGGRLDHFNVSNRGVVDGSFSSKEHLKLKELFVTTLQWRLGNTLSCHALSINSQLMLSLSSVYCRSM